MKQEERNDMRLKTSLIVTLVGGVIFGAYSPPDSVQAGLVVLPPITNPGAEAGNASGWNDQGGIYAASNVSAAREGSWFFETNEHLALFGAREMTQTIDVSNLTGTIEDVEFSVSLAANQGFAEITGPQAQTWRYGTQASLRFFDIDMNRLPIVLLGPFEEGNDSLLWTDRVISWATTIPQNWDQNRSSIAFIELGLSGAWLSSTGSVADPPPGSIVDVPAVTRFDNIGLNIVVPEPATLTLLTLLGIGGLAILKRRRSGQLVRDPAMIDSSNTSSCYILLRTEGRSHCSKTCLRRGRRKGYADGQINSSISNVHVDNRRSDGSLQACAS